MRRKYIPEFLTEEDRQYYEKAGWGEDFEVGKKPAVLVVDMTRAFVEDRFPLGCSKTGIPAAQSIARLIEIARQRATPVFYSTGYANRKPAEKGCWMHKGTEKRSTDAMDSEEAHEIFPLIAPMQDDIVFAKAKPSIFFGTQLVSMLNFLYVDTLIITGMVTSGCVRATVVDAFSYNYRVIVPEECVADRCQVAHQINLFDIDSKYGNVNPLDEVLAYLETIQDPVK